MAFSPFIAHEDDRLTVHQVVVGQLDNNVYVIRSKQTGEALLIDAAAAPESTLR